MSPELAWMVAIFWIGRKFRCGQRGSWLISWFFIAGGWRTARSETVRRLRPFSGAAVAVFANP